VIEVIRRLPVRSVDTTSSDRAAGPLERIAMHC
jgi:hypothetical protein